MIEIVMIVALCVLMWRVAEIDDLPRLLWSMVTLGLCVLSLSLPWPFLRILLAGAAAFVLMLIYKIVARK